MTHITQNLVEVRGAYKTSTEMIIPLLDIFHQCSHSGCAKIRGEQIEMQGKHIGSLCSSLKRTIRKDKAFDKCITGLLGQFVILLCIIILAQNVCDLCKQVAAISKKGCTN